MLVELEHPRHDAFEECPVVADHHDAAGEVVEERLEPGQACEVEVVRRLVEQEHVEAAEQDRRQRRRAPPVHPRATRSATSSSAFGSPRSAQHRVHPGVEVGTSGGEEGIERGGVGVAASASSASGSPSATAVRSSSTSAA